MDLSESGNSSEKTKVIAQRGEELVTSYQRSIPHLSIQGGIPFPGLLLSKRFQEIPDFKVRSDDLLIAGYPRSGNHWMKEIISQLYSDEASVYPERSNGQHAFERIPILEMAVDIKECMQTYMENYFRRCGPLKPGLAKIATKFGLISSEKLFSQTFLDPLQDLEERPSPRLYHTHLPYHMLPTGCQEGKCRIIYVMRNGKDVALSFYEMHKMYPPFGYYSGHWREFLYTFLKGQVCFGSWFTHIEEWWSKRHMDHVLFVAYEDMIENLPREVKRIADFLEKDFPPTKLDDIVQKCTFKSMRDNPTATYDGLHESIDTKNTTFLRKGKVGDWKARMTVEDSEYFDAVYQNALKNGAPDLRFELPT